MQLLDELLWAPARATEELLRRKADADLKKKVEEYLDGDIPQYFNGQPVLYLARHVASPNFETLRFKYLLDLPEFKIVIGQDSKDQFVPMNKAKKALGKLPICIGISQAGDKVNERFEHLTIIDFNSAAGKPFSEIRTVWGESLMGVHARLFTHLAGKGVETPDDAAWIDRHHRGDLLEHYKHFLALFVAHGALFEDYLPDDAYETDFVRDVLLPASAFVEERFGVYPLVVPLLPETRESSRFWMSYPACVLDIVRANMEGVLP